MEDLSYGEADGHFLADFVVGGHNRLCLVFFCPRLLHGLDSGLHSPMLIDLIVKCHSVF